MATNFPTSLDSLLNPESSDSMSVVSHAAQHQNANDAIEALQAKIGINGSAVTTSLDYLLKNPNQVNPGHKHTMAAIEDLEDGTLTFTGKTISGVDNTLNVRLTNDVSGNLPVNRLNSGTGAGQYTFWNGAGVWSRPITNYIDPVSQYGAKFDAVGDHTGAISGVGNNEFASSAYTFTLADVDKKIYYDATERTITGATSGRAIFTPAGSGPASNLYWLCGTDDTVAIQNALDAARDMQGIDIAETAGGTNGLIMMGGTVVLPHGKAAIISNSSADYAGGKLSALKVYRRTEFRGAGSAISSSSLCLKPGSYGHMIANSDPTGGANSYSDYITIAKMTLYGYQDWNPNALDGVHLRVAFDGYDKVDPWNRVYDVQCSRVKRNGFYFQGRGELIVEKCVSINAAQYGFHFNGQSDYKVVGCESGGAAKTGFRIYSSGAAHYIACKSFYSGSNGGSVAADCTNWHVSGDQMRNGGCWFTSCEGQESRGSAWMVDNCGLNIFNGCTALDPGREALASSGTLPSVVAGWHLLGEGCRQNVFNGCTSTPSVAAFNMTNNWGYATDAVYIADVDVNGSGPQHNRGDIYTFVPSINNGGTLDVGTKYRPGYGPRGGAGFTNGRNVLLRVDGVTNPAVIPGQVKDLTIAALNASLNLTWNVYFDGGSAITDYIIEYKLSTEPTTWTTLSDGTSTAKTATITGLTNGLSYDVRVKAVNVVGTGPVSATSTASPTSTLLGLISSAVMDVTTAETSSYSGTGQTWANLVSAPADGSATTAYDLILGTDSGSAANDPTFSGTAGTGAAAFTLDGGDWFTIKNGNTTLINNMHKTTGGASWSIAMVCKVPSRLINTNPYYLFGTGGGDAAKHGIAVKNGTFGANPNKLTFEGAGGSFVQTSTLTGINDITDGTYRLVVVTYNAATKALKAYSGSNTPVSTTIGFFASTTNASDPLQFFTGGGAFLPCPTGTEVKSIGMFNAILSDAQVALLQTFYGDRHGITL